MSLDAQNIDDPKKNDGWYRYGVQYSSEIPSTIGFKKPDTNALRANHGHWGNPTQPDETIRKSVEEILKQQEEKRKKEIKKQIRQAKWWYTIYKVLPTRLFTFFRNMPIINVKSVYSYIRAEVSNIEQGPVSLPVYEERKKICGECPKRMFPEGYSDPLGFCTECGCGANPRAQLTVKLKLPATSCPLGKWDEAPGIYEGLWGRIRYIITRRRSK
jgi:hypothetical protein